MCGEILQFGVIALMLVDTHPDDLRFTIYDLQRSIPPLPATNAIRLKKPVVRVPGI